MEYILALLLTSSVIFISYRVGKRAGIKEEQLRIANEKNREWEQFVDIVNSNTELTDDSFAKFVQEQRDKSTSVSIKI